MELRARAVTARVDDARGVRGFQPLVQCSVTAAVGRETCVEQRADALPAAAHELAGGALVDETCTRGQGIGEVRLPGIRRARAAAIPPWASCVLPALP